MQLSWYVYLLSCSDNSVYCGITKNINKRVCAHNKGKGAIYTRGRRPVKVEICVGPMSKSDALKLEMKIKQLPTSRKISTLSEWNAEYYNKT